MPRGGARNCGKCGQHPRSATHREKCMPIKKTQTTGATVGRVAATKKTTRIRRTRVSEPAPDPSILPENWVLGATCLTCHTHYKGWEPEFQPEDSAQGGYDVTAQLPNTSHDYPICPTCLPWHWKTEMRRLGVEADVRRVYPEMFV